MDNSDIAIAKLLNIFNHAVDKATGPDAVSLINSYMTYIMVSNALSLAFICVWFVATGVSTYWLLSASRKYNEMKKEGTYYGQLEEQGFVRFIYFWISVVMVVITIPLLLSALPQVLAVLYDPRLHFVFKVMR